MDTFATTDFACGPTHLFARVHSCTEFNEFKLAGDAKHAKATADFENKVAKERKELRRLSEQHARPLPETTYRAFEVQHPDRAPLVARDINLNSSVRAVHRKSYDARNKARIRYVLFQGAEELMHHD